MNSHYSFGKISLAHLGGLLCASVCLVGAIGMAPHAREVPDPKPLHPSEIQNPNRSVDVTPQKNSAKNLGRRQFVQTLEKNQKFQVSDRKLHH